MGPDVDPITAQLSIDKRLDEGGAVLVVAMTEGMELDGEILQF